jgi:maltose O-acetyltransferase
VYIRVIRSESMIAVALNAERAPGAAGPSGPVPGLPRARVGSVHWRLFALELLFRAVPPFVANRLRTQGLRAAGVSIGRATLFWGLPTLLGSGPICSRLRIGEYCGFNADCVFDLEDSITVGDHVGVGSGVMFLSRSYGPGSGAQRAGDSIHAPIVIGNGVWLGSRCTILAGVTIGASSVIGAGVVVTQNVPENTLLTGAAPISIARWR